MVVHGSASHLVILWHFMRMGTRTRKRVCLTDDDRNAIMIRSCAVRSGGTHFSTKLMLYSLCQVRPTFMEADAGIGGGWANLPRRLARPVR